MSLEQSVFRRILDLPKEVVPSEIIETTGIEVIEADEVVEANQVVAPDVVIWTAAPANSNGSTVHDHDAAKLVPFASTLRHIA